MTGHTLGVAHEPTAQGAVRVVGQRVVGASAVWVGALVAASTLLRGLVSLGQPAPWILPDELLYADLARSVAAGHLPAVRGVTTFGWGVVYPVLIAPAWRLFDEPVVAYHAALWINAFVMSLAAVPAYLLARLFVARGGSMLVAVGAVLVPSMALTSTVMTENAAYPAFLLALWLVARAVRTPTVAGQAATLGAIALLGATRVQGLVLAPVLVLAVALYAPGRPQGERLSYLRRFWPTAAVLGALVSLPLTLAALDRGGGVFGQRSGTLDFVRFGELPRLVLYQMGDLLLFVAIVPALATATMIGIGLGRRAREAERLFAAVALPAIAAVVGSTVAVSSTYDIAGSELVNERYVFYLVPVVLVGLAVWIDAGLPRPRWALAVAIGCVLIPALLPFDRLDVDARFYAQALAPWAALPLPRVATGAVVGACALAVATLWLRCPRDRGRRLWTASLAGTGLLAVVTVMGFTARADTAAGVYGPGPLTWVDDAVPAGKRVVVLWDRHRDAAEGPAPVGWMSRLDYRLMLTEFFNPSIEAVYRLGEPTITENHLPTRRAQVADFDALLADNGRPVTAGIVLASRNCMVAGRRLARSADGALILVEVNGPVRVRGTRCNQVAS